MERDDFGDKRRRRSLDQYLSSGKGSAVKRNTNLRVKAKRRKKAEAKHNAKIRRRHAGRICADGRKKFFETTGTKQEIRHLRYTVK